MTTNPSAPTRRYLTLAEASSIARLSTRTLRRAIATSALPAHRVGRVIRIGESALYVWLETHRVTPLIARDR